MSHHFISKKVWIGVIILTCLFFGLTYIWMYYTNQLIRQAGLPRSETESTVQGAKSPEPEEPVEEAARYNQEPIEAKDPAVSFPCLVQLQQGRLGLYDLEGRCLQELHQVGEWLSETDEKQLREGIKVQNEEELIMTLESYHLQKQNRK